MYTHIAQHILKGKAYTVYIILSLAIPSLARFLPVVMMTSAKESLLQHKLYTHICTYRKKPGAVSEAIVSNR